MATMTQGLCEICKNLKETAYTDPVGREYCTDCFSYLPVPTASRIVEYLMLTIPFKVGERVECRTVGVLFDGTGVITEISIDPETFGTPAFPSFNVVIDDPAYPEAPKSCWYMETQLKKVDDMGVKKYGDDIPRDDDDLVRGDADNDEASQATHEPTGNPGDDWNDTPNLPEV
jgi:hypothetical protein